VQLYDTYINERHQYSFINFNYTYLLDISINLIEGSSISHVAKTNPINDRIGSICHIHGTYDQNVLLGVNDISQISNEGFHKANRLTSLFVKPQANKFSKQGVHEDCEQLIDKSKIIVIFGMSIGKTDAFWWNKIINWLMHDGSRQLVIFQYRDKYDPALRDCYTDCVEDTFELLKNYGLNDVQREALEERIHIVLKNNLLGLPLI